MIERDIRVHLYAAARLAKLGSRRDVTRALYTIFARPFPDATPPTVDEDRVRERRTARESREGVRPKPGVDYGFSPAFDALWIVQESLPDFGADPPWSVETWKQMFNRDRTLWRAVEKFARDPDGYAAWRDGAKRVPEDEFFRIVLSGDRAAGLACLGIPLFGTTDGLVWIGLTNDVSLLNLEDPSERVARIQGIDERRLQVREKFEALCLDAARELDVLIFEIIRELGRLGLTPAPRYLVYLLAGDFCSWLPPQVSQFRIKQAIHRLQLDGWIRDPSDEIRELGFSNSEWQVNYDFVGIGGLNLIPWVLENREKLKPYDFRNLLGAQAASSADPQLIPAILDAIEPTMPSNSHLRAEYGWSITRAGDPDRAERLLRGFQGEPGLIQYSWAYLAERWLAKKEYRRFCDAIQMLDDSMLSYLVRRIDFGSQSQRFHDLLELAVVDQAYRPIVERLVIALDAAFPAVKFRLQFVRRCQEPSTR